MLNYRDPAPCPQIGQMMEFAHRAFQATTVIFYWVNENTEMVDFQTQGVSSEFMDRYRAGMNHLDPLIVRRLAQNQRKVALLHEEGADRPESAAYIEFLRTYNIVDNLEFVFWNEGAPFAGLGVLRNVEDAPLDTMTMNVDAIQQYMEFNLLMHPHVREARLQTTLANRFKLTHREIEVVSLLCGGSSNCDISDVMGIGVATVKTHVVNILNKLGVDNRSSVVGLMMNLQ